MKKLLRSSLQNFPPKFVLLVSIGTTLLGGLLYLYLKLVSEILEKEMDALDSAVYALVHLWDSTVLHGFMLFITQTGSPFALIVLSLPLLAWMYRQQYRVQTFLFFVTTIAGGGVINTLLKNLYQRERPLINDAIGAYGYSLPSGHAMISVLFYGTVTYFVLRTRYANWVKALVALLTFVMIVLIGMSRVYLEAHYFSDVLAGYLCGAMWLGVCIAVFDGRRVYKKYIMNHMSLKNADTL